MSNTKRVYNSPNLIFGIWTLHGIGWQCFWHPYKELSIGTPSGSHKSEHAKQRRLRYKEQLTTELKHVCPYEHFNECSSCSFNEFNSSIEVCKYAV